jgi:hypothetical protein
MRVTAGVVSPRCPKRWWASEVPWASRGEVDALRESAGVGEVVAVTVIGGVASAPLQM